MNRDWRDHATRAVFVAAGVVAAALLVMQGEATAVPALAVGGALGACLVRQAEPEE